MAAETGKRISPHYVDVADATLDRPFTAFVVIDPKTHEILSVTQGFRKICCDETPIGRSIFDFIDPSDRTQLISQLAALNSFSEMTSSLEIRFRTPPEDDATWKVISVAALSQDPDGSTQSILLDISNIDETQTVERKKALRERRWNYALVSSGLGVWDHNYRTNEFFYSQTWRTMRGHPAFGSLPFNSTEEWLENVHPDDRAFVANAIERQKLGDPRFMNFEYRERHADGHWIWIECRGDAVEFFADNHPARVVGTDRDISERMGNAALLDQTKKRLELALKTSQIGVYEANLDTCKALTDVRLREIYGLDEKTEIVDLRVIGERIHPDDNSRAILKTPLPAFSNGQQLSEEVRIYRKNDGALRHIRHLGTFHKDSNGNPFITGVVWDVTEQSRLKQDLVTAKQLAEARNFELDSARSDIEHAALHDYLTSLPNRHFLEGELSRRIEIGGSSHIALLQFDIDEFNSINVAYGHKSGDTVLQHVAQTLIKSSKHNDFVARVGGDEFVLVCSYEGGRTVPDQIAKRLLLEISKPFDLNGHRCKLSASIGIVTDETTDDKNTSTLLKNSDIAVKKAKRLGGGQTVFYAQSMEAPAAIKRTSADRLMEAVESNAFVPFYQPQYDSRSGKLFGVETLARWKKPDNSYALPADFVTMAETLNLMNLIDASVLTQALADNAELSSKGISLPRISLNLSPRRLSDPALIAALEELDLPSGKLSFELLESIFLDDQDDISAYNLREIRRLGIDIDVDDFGTGYTSITGLLKVSPQSLKIAQELVQPITRSPEQKAVVSSIVDIGKALGIRVIAEGVETRQQADLLTEIGCDVLQGYLLARPMPFKALEELLTNMTCGTEEAVPGT